MDEFNKDINGTPEEKPAFPDDSRTENFTPDEIKEAGEAVKAEAEETVSAAEAAVPEEKPSGFVPPFSTYKAAEETPDAAPDTHQDAPAEEKPSGFVPPFSTYKAPEETAESASPAARENAPESIDAQQETPGTVEEKTGEYTYVPPFPASPAPAKESEAPATSPAPSPAAPAPVYSAGSAGSAPVMVQPASSKKEKKQKAKKEKKGFSAGAVALLLVSCILLSFAAGIGGALLYDKFGKTDKDSLVVYKTPETDDKDTGKKDEGKKDADKDEGNKTPEPAADGSLSVSDVCAVVADSVVEIDTEFKTTYGFYQYVSDGAGSGVIISADGYVITNNHVIFNNETGKVADSVTVRLADGTEYEAEITGRDADADIALLKVEAKDLSPATIGNSSSLKVGETILAVGNPLGELGGTVTCGIVSATNREISVDSNKMNLIQIDAAVNPGNSGGGMFNMKGELVGIVNAKSSGSDVDGLGFAIPVDDAMAVVEELQNHGYVTGKSYIGVSLIDVTDMYTAYYYFRSQQPGVFVAQVQEGFNDKVLKYGDRIIAIDDTEITSTEDVKSIVKTHKVGDVMKFSISRDGKFMTVNVTCCEYVPEKNVTFDDKKADK